ncbi:FMN-binding negative transcriptional regulator [Luteibacter jiangsuensis]|uniref:FMN-binding negative transcriptional regulator n=1 Tax=Luteibacter jiangsuensis TaxID=637577 RepID=A0ABX0PZ66_9GAMM|nr:FMN-binding negative transcriptional regulator [Luteibacter jiangsuensis]NID03671.1 FMN-binding negative transcriptional regulator [Luteibacter jiangsuensis]
MYTPKDFVESRLPVLHDAIRANAFGTLVTAGEGGIEATHVPFVLARDEGPMGTLYAHVARGNDHVARHAGEVLSMFTGPHAYISPNGYPGKATHHREVPTWNYIAVHAYGTAETFTDPDRLLDLLSRLTEQSEHDTGQAQPWKLSDAPADYVAPMLRGIVGIRIPIARIEGKWKLGQNRPAADREGSARLLEQCPGDNEQAIAEAMRSV